MEKLVGLSLYRDKKVFITGHTGFKGAWLTTCLHILGANVKGYALAPEYKNGLYDVIEPLNIHESVIADIRDRPKLEKEIRSFQPDVVFHLAAQPLVRRSYEIPAETFDINVTGTANLLEAVNSVQNKCNVIVVTTDKVYENKEQDVFYNETDRLGGYDPYSASKACAEMVVTSFHNSFFNSDTYNKHKKAIASARAGNVIGGGDWSTDRIIPDIIRALESGNEIDVRNPSAIRPWQHVLEPIAGYLLLGSLLDMDGVKYSGAYNFGPMPGDHLVVKELVELAIQSWGNGSWKDQSKSEQPHEAGILKLNINKSINQLNWKPKLNAKEAIDWTVQWYKQSKASQADFTFHQIKTYFGL